MGGNCKYLTNFLDAFEGGWEFVDVESWFVPPFSCYKKTKHAIEYVNEPGSMMCW